MVRLTDASPDLNYLNNRYQDPTTGVFLSVDPLVSKTGQPYLYGSGSPATLSDPTGLCPGAGYVYGVCVTDGEENDDDFRSRPKSTQWMVEWSWEWRQRMKTRAKEIGCSNCPDYTDQGNVGPTATSICWNNADLCDDSIGDSDLGTSDKLSLIDKIGALPADEFYDLAMDPKKIREQGLEWLNWSNDGCSNSPNGVAGTSFLGPCARHDFSYRNLKGLESVSGEDLFNDDSQRRADNFLRDGINDACGMNCDWASPIYWLAVNAFGDDDIVPWQGWLPFVGL